MFGIDDVMDAQCPQCANDKVYVEKLVTHPADERDMYLCRCGKCGWRFRVEAAEAKRGWRSLVET
jgi:DNA-directed RNA polymerase subunit M/transcription elongation factor TFIIS